MIQYARLFIIIIDTVGVQLRELLHNLNALVLVFLLRLQLILALVPLQTRTTILQNKYSYLNAVKRSINASSTPLIILINESRLRLHS